KTCGNIITVRDPDSRPDVASRAASPDPAKKPLEHALQNAFSEDAPTKAAQAPEFPTQGADDDEWYVAIQGQQQGPIPFAQLEQFFERGAAREESYVWRDGMEDWARAGDVPELR